MPTTSVRRLISPFKCSIGFVLCSLARWAAGHPAKTKKAAVGAGLRYCLRDLRKPALKGRGFARRLLVDYSRRVVWVLRGQQEFRRKRRCRRDRFIGVAAEKCCTSAIDVHSFDWPGVFRFFLITAGLKTI
jgi:hypothetical protein